MKKYEIPNKMKAMVLTGIGTWELQDDVDVPVPGPEEVLCKIGGVAICGSDPEIIEGGLPGVWPPAYPFIAGHEWAGRVVAVGENVSGFQVGDRVAGEAHKGCGHCRNCLEGRYTLCFNYGKPETGHRHYGFITNGAYGQYNTYHIKSITKLPDNVSYMEAAMCDTASVSLHGLELSGIRPGGSVAIIGPGPIGIMAMKLAFSMGAAKVIMVGRAPRLQTAMDMGCSAAVDFSKENPVEGVLALTDGIGVDLAVECSGAAGTLEQCIRMCCKGGKVVLLGVAKEGVMEPIPFKHTTHSEIAIFGSRANPNTCGKVVNLMSSGSLKVKDMVTHTFDLDQIGEAFDTFIGRKDGAMKVVIYPNSEREEV